MKNILLKSLSAFTILSMSFMSNIAVAQEAFVEEGLVGNNEGNQVWICHATSSENNPYNAIQVNENGLNGHGDHEDDIIPITDMDNDQDIDDDDCSLAVGTDQDEDNNDCDQPSLTQDEEGDCDDDGCDQQDTPSIDNNEDCDDQEDGGGCDEQQDSIVDDNEDDCDDEDCPQVEGILVDEGGNDDCDDGEEQVCVEGNLIENGGFETPVAPNGGWNVYDSGTSGLGWDVAWNGSFVGAPETAKLELHHGVGGWVPDEGDQYAELDSDWQGPSGGGSEQASVEISQKVDTIEGQTYDLSYAFSPRPGTGAGENVLEVLVNGDVVQTQGPTIGAGNTSWTTYTYSFEADSDSTTIAFRDAGTPNTLGTFLDDISLNCGDEPEEEDGPSCDNQEIWARVNIEDYSTQGDGDVTNTVYVGSTINTYASNEWFMVYDGTNYINDPDISTFEDVPGLAVQRMNGKLRLSLYGAGDYPQDLETAEGYIEFWSANVTGQSSVFPPNFITEIVGNEPFLPYPAALLDYLTYTGDESHFDLHVSDGSDRFDTTFVFAQDEECGDPQPENATVTICKQDDEQNFLPGWEVALYSTDSAEQVQVNPDGLVHSSAVYGAGAYKLEANGTYIYRNFHNQGTLFLPADAAYSLRHASDNLNPIYYSPSTLWYFSGVSGHLGIKVNDAFPVWGNTFNPSHQYFYTTNLAVSDAFDFKITDDQYADNTGFLTVDIYPGYTGTTGENGCVTFEDVPFGTYDLSEIMQEGWEYVSGAGEVVVDEANETFYVVNHDDSEDGDPEDPQCEVDCGPAEPTCQELQNCEDDEPETPNNSQPENNPGRTTSSGSFGGGGGQVLGAKTKGDVLGACVQFTEYHKKGDKGGEIPMIQEFLNDELGLSLVVNGIYDQATFDAVKAFQKKYFDQIITPWFPALPLKVTGKWYKTTRMMANEIIACPEPAVFLEDPQILYKVKWTPAI